VQLAQKLLSTRGGTIAVSAVAAVLAAVVLFAYLHRYRESVKAASEPMTVLVAKGLIEKGTPGDIVGSDALFQVTTAPRSDVKVGAITDPATLRGKIAVADVYPGEQLTVEAFSATGADAMGTSISAAERAITIPVDSAHGMVGNIQDGDRVDVFAGFNVKKLQADGTPVPNAQERPVLKLIVEDLLVLRAPTAQAGLGGGSGEKNASVTVRADDDAAAKIAFASDNGSVWVVLRPRTGAKPTPPDIVTLETLLFDAKPVAVQQSFGGAR
jgi:Flp pilus assembly protein CpaB